VLLLLSLVLLLLLLSLPPLPLIAAVAFAAATNTAAAAAVAINVATAATAPAAAVMGCRFSASHREYKYFIVQDGSLDLAAMQVTNGDVHCQCNHCQGGLINLLWCLPACLSRFRNVVFTSC
jgi:hypothetical protein